MARTLSQICHQHYDQSLDLIVGPCSEEGTMNNDLVELHTRPMWRNNIRGPTHLGFEGPQ